MFLSGRVPANQLLDTLAVVRERHTPPGFMQFEALCGAPGCSEAQLAKLLDDLKALDAVQSDKVGRVAFLTRALRRPAG